ncbi:MAG: hypothetical protein PHT51_03910 [Patescibacteria group bacterium]|nr:hypothetical protein [Patescibacteria group bacterium]
MRDRGELSERELVDLLRAFANYEFVRVSTSQWKKTLVSFLKIRDYLPYAQEIADKCAGKIERLWPIARAMFTFDLVFNRCPEQRKRTLKRLRTMICWSLFQASGKK